MRYRPLAHFELSVSAVSLALADDSGAKTPKEWAALVYAALDVGINCFEVQGRHPAILAGLDEALQAIERRLAVVCWRAGDCTTPAQYAGRGYEPQMIQAAVQSALSRTKLGYFDILLLDDPGEADLPPQSLALLKGLKSRGLVRYIGVAGVDEAIDAYISTRAFDILAQPFNMTSGWRERLRIRAAQEAGMAVMGYDSFPAVLRPRSARRKEKRSFWSPRRERREPGAYDFLVHTPNWTAEEICLAFSLTEPALASVQVRGDDPKHLQALASVAEREMPACLPAQIEMARVVEGQTPYGRKTA